MNLKKICENVIEITKDVGCFIRKEAKNISTDDIEIKGLHNFVTYVDKTAEKRLIAQLKKILPVPAGFLVEENTSAKDLSKSYLWVIDPLDGTTNFIHRMPLYSISIALMQNDEVILGIVYEINFKECFYAYKGSKAYMNGKEIHVSNVKTLDDSLLVTGFPTGDYSYLKNYLKLWEYFVKHTHGIRRLGSAAVDLAYVACGRLDGFYEVRLNPWDVAAGSFIVQQAGGKVTDFNGGKNFIFGKEIICSGKPLHKEFLKTVRKFMK